MPRGSELSKFEMGQITALYAAGKSGREIANLINRSKTVVYNYLQKKENYGKLRRTGRPKSLNNRDKRQVFRLISTGNYSCSKVRSSLGLNVHRTIYRAVKGSKL